MKSHIALGKCFQRYFYLVYFPFHYKKPSAQREASCKYLLS